MRSTAKDILALTAGLGAGAGLMYLFDPARGRVRRGRLIGETAGLFRRDERRLIKQGKYWWNRARGAVSGVASTFAPAEHVDDEVLVERVRAKLGHIVSNPHEIQVHAANGVVRLEGNHLPHSEQRRLRKEIEAIPGVRCVHDGTTRRLGLSPGFLAGVAAGLGFIGKVTRARASE